MDISLTIRSFIIKFYYMSFNVFSSKKILFFFYQLISFFSFPPEFSVVLRAEFYSTIHYPIENNKSIRNFSNDNY